MLRSHLGLWAFLACIFQAWSASADDSLRFLYPLGGLTFYYMNTLVVQYESNYSSPYLYTWCRLNGGGVTQKQLNFPSPRNASAEIKLDFDSADQCWFELRPEAVDASDPEVPGVNSPGWSYKILAVNDTTVSLSTVSQTSTAASTSTSTTQTLTSDAQTITSTTSATSTPISTSTASSSNSSGGLPMGAQVGIGIGIGIAGLAAIAAIVPWIICRRRKAKQSPALLDSTAIQPPPSGNPAVAGAWGYYPGGPGTELPGSTGGAYEETSLKFRSDQMAYHPGAQAPQMYELPSRLDVYEMPHSNR